MGENVMFAKTFFYGLCENYVLMMPSHGGAVYIIPVKYYSEIVHIIVLFLVHLHSNSHSCS